jgi:hypothetical protein
MSRIEKEIVPIGVGIGIGIVLPLSIAEILLGSFSMWGII